MDRDTSAQVHEGRQEVFICYTWAVFFNATFTATSADSDAYDCPTNVLNFFGRAHFFVYEHKEGLMSRPDLFVIDSSNSNHTAASNLKVNRGKRNEQR